MDLSAIAYGFIIYSFIGWVSECLYARYIQKKWVNRGFLHGPFCPIYGTGAMLVTVILQPLNLDGFSLFAAAIVVTSSLEFLTSYIMEKIWHLRWWDYSDAKFNFDGRICLSASLVWGIVCVFMVNVINPTLFVLLQSIPSWLYGVALIVLVSIMGADLITTIIRTQNLSNKLSVLAKLKAQIKSIGAEASEEAKEKYHNLCSHIANTNKRILRAFPSAASKKLSLSFKSLKSKIKQIK